MKRLLCAIGLTLSVGCATAVVRPYIGEQQSWPTATGSIVSTKYDFPVFTSLPPSQYDVVAELRIDSALYAQPEEGHLPVLIKEAKKLNTDALVFVEGDIFFSTSYGSRTSSNGDEVEGGSKPSLTSVNRFNPDSFKPGVTILAVRWLGDPPAGLRKYSYTPTPAPKAETAPKPEDTPATIPAVKTEPEKKAEPAPATPPAAKPAPTTPTTPTPPAPAPPTPPVEFH